MEHHRRRKQQRSRERKEEAAAKEAVVKEAAATPRLEVGVADRKLDALIEEELRSRAKSVPASSCMAEMKRLGASAAESLRAPQGPPVTYHPQPAQEQVHQLVMDPRGQSMGLGHLQEAVRHSFESSAERTTRTSTTGSNST